MKRSIVAVLSMIGLALALLATAAPATAASRFIGFDGYETRCLDAGFKLCLYYNSGTAGAYWGTNVSVSDIGTRRFGTAGAGNGQLIKNNAASMMCGYTTPNRCTSYFNSGFLGNSDWMYWGQKGNLYYTYNDEAAVRIS